MIGSSSRVNKLGYSCFVLGNAYCTKYKCDGASSFRSVIKCKMNVLGRPQGQTLPAIAISNGEVMSDESILITDN